MGWGKNINPALIFPQRLGKWGMTRMTRMISHRYRSLQWLEVGRCLFHYGDAFARCHCAVFVCGWALRYWEDPYPLRLYALGKVWIRQLPRRDFRDIIRNPSKMARSAAGCESKSASMDANGCPQAVLMIHRNSSASFPWHLPWLSEDLCSFFRAKEGGFQRWTAQPWNKNPSHELSSHKTNLKTATTAQTAARTTRHILNFWDFQKRSWENCPYGMTKGSLNFNYALCLPYWGTSLKTISYPRICHVRLNGLRSCHAIFNKTRNMKENHEHKHQKTHFFVFQPAHGIFYICIYYITLSTTCGIFCWGPWPNDSVDSHGGLFSISHLWRESRGKCGASKEAEASWS